MVLTLLPDELVQMRQLAVLPEFRGRGIGVRLVQAAEAQANLLRARALVFYPRDEAVQFYLALGYVAEADWFEGIGVPSQMMAKRL